MGFVFLSVPIRPPSAEVVNMSATIRSYNLCCFFSFFLCCSVRKSETPPLFERFNPTIPFQLTKMPKCPISTQRTSRTRAESPRLHGDPDHREALWTHALHREGRHGSRPVVRLWPIKRAKSLDGWSLRRTRSSGRRLQDIQDSD